MNEILQNIYQRRAVRKYKNIGVERHLIDDVIAAGTMAPSAKNEQSWKFYVLTDREKIKKLSKEIAHRAYHHLKDVSLKDIAQMTLSMFHFSTIKDLILRNDHVFYGAPVVIFITSPVHDEWGGLNTGMCAQNMMLAAQSLGLATCPIGFARMVSEVEDYYLLNIGSNEQIELALTLGYANEAPATPPRENRQVTYLDA